MHDASRASAALKAANDDHYPRLQSPVRRQTLPLVAPNHSVNTPAARGYDGQATSHESTTQQNLNAVPYGASLLDVDTAVGPRSITHRAHSPASIGLSLQTDFSPATPVAASAKEEPTSSGSELRRDSLYPTSTLPIAVPRRGSSLLSGFSAHGMPLSASPGSAKSYMASPFLAAMSDITPLPSPLVASQSPEKWSNSDKSTPPRFSSLDASSTTGRCSPPTSPGSPHKRKKGYGSLMPAAVEGAIANNVAAIQVNRQAAVGHGRHRSISDFKPEHLQNLRQRRHVTLGPTDLPINSSEPYHMHREAYIAAQRGLTIDPTKALPSPPPSNASNASIAESSDAEEDPGTPLLEDGERSNYLQIHCGINHRKRRFRPLRHLGQGTFSKVFLATNQRVPARLPPGIEQMLDHSRLVAIKIVEHGPAGGADEERIEIGLKREVDMLKSISHPSLVHLKAWETQETRTLLVLSFCPGGDLFEVASEHRDILTPRLVQRIFSELVSAVRYLHNKWIVHRDIKLENVLVNIPIDSLRAITDPTTHAAPLVILTDLGLGRRIPDPPESPLLTTRCGSEDYAAPEILLGQSYDGRQTDAWALGVLLYALIEGRLPFDGPPGKPDRSRNTHRIARCDWIWCRFGDEDGEWDSSLPGSAEWEGARLCVEGLLKKVRMGRKPLEEIEKMEYVQQGIKVEGGLQLGPDHEDDLS